MREILLMADVHLAIVMHKHEEGYMMTFEITYHITWRNCRLLVSTIFKVNKRDLESLLSLF